MVQVEAEGGVGRAGVVDATTIVDGLLAEPRQPGHAQ
jgi:hypothetical protein